MIRVVAGIIEDHGRVLVCQRHAGGVLGLKWEFPGGKLRRSEVPRAGLIRELQEELGVVARIGRQVYAVRHRYAEMKESVLVTFFLVALPERPRWFNRVAFERVEWARRGDLPRYDFLAADRKLVARMARGEFAAYVGMDQPPSTERTWPVT